MTQTRDIVSQALLEIRVSSSHGGADPQDAKDALAKLNRLMHALANDGLTYEHTTLSMSDDFPWDASLEEPAIMWLAKNIAGQYAKSLTRERAEKAEEGETAIDAAYRAVPDSVFDSGLIRLPSNRRYWGR